MIGKNESATDIVQAIFNESSAHDEDLFDAHIIQYGPSTSSVNSVGVDVGLINDDQLVVDNLYIWIFLATFGAAGIIFNLIIIYGLLRAKCNGGRYYLLQLAFCDIGALCISGLELVYINYQRWIPSAEFCPVYLGMESFTSTASIYFIIALNMHAISVYNLTIDTIERRNLAESEYTQLESDAGDNDNYEVAIDARERRSLTIDYGQRKRGIAVVMPALFVWFLGASMAIPLFVFGSVIPNEMDPLICGVMNFDKHSNLIMQTFVGVIRVVVPAICLHWSMGCVIVKLRSSKDKLESPCVLDENARHVLKMAMLLSSTLAFFGMQKIYGSLLFEIVTKPFMHYKYPFMDRNIGLALSTLSFILPAVRPVMYLGIDRRLCVTIFRCCHDKKRTNQLDENEEDFD